MADHIKSRTKKVMFSGFNTKDRTSAKAFAKGFKGGETALDRALKSLSLLLSFDKKSKGK